MSLFRNIVNALVYVIKGFRKASFKTLAIDLLAYLPSIVQEVENIIESTKGTKTAEDIKLLIDEALEDFDNTTGTEGLKLISGMPVDKMEITLDHFKEFSRGILYNVAKVDGWYSPSINNK